MTYKEFLLECPDYIELVRMYQTGNVDIMGEKFLQETCPYYSMSNRMRVMEYPYLKLGEF